jgi:NADH:ubiquinone oxidoreductase subunit 5 (subunit L)/multisubunit Na+/H+ antiporter MnhA subunit
MLINMDNIIKCGAVFSLIGTVIMIILVSVILIFPVQKNCDGNDSDCQFISTAPGILRSIVSPLTLVIALLTVATGLLIFRFGTRYKLRKSHL